MIPKRQQNKTNTGIQKQISGIDLPRNMPVL